MKPGVRAGEVAGKTSRSQKSTLSKTKHATRILSAIDKLRNRKLRPDLSRICHMVHRQHQLTAEQTSAELDILVDEKLVIKVDFKGSASYRNAANRRRKQFVSTQAGQTAAGFSKRNRTQRRVLKAVRNLSRQLVNKSTKSGDSTLSSAKAHGVTLTQIENWIRQKWRADVADSMSTIKAAATAEVGRGTLTEVIEGTYILDKDELNMATKPGTEQPQKRGPGRPKTDDKIRVSSAKSGTVSEVEGALSSSGSLADSSAVPVITGKISSQKKFGGKRKPKLRKSIDQEVESLTAKKSRSDELEPSVSAETTVTAAAVADSVICTYCQSVANRQGNIEDLLICKDCNAKIHPSCMDLTEQLARRAARSPWQCIDCKTCNVCDDSGYADEMLFCDACDKGYHMNCHKPPVLEKPTDTDKWVCSRCVAELETTDVVETVEPAPLVVNTDNDNKVEDCGDAVCLPTPSDSPVHFKEETVPIVLPKEISPPTASETVVALPKLSATLPSDPPDASKWSVTDVAKYFSDVGFNEQAETFRAEEIDGRALLLMTRNDVLTAMSFKLGPALKIYAHVQRLQTRDTGVFL